MFDFLKKSPVQAATPPVTQADQKLDKLPVPQPPKYGATSFDSLPSLEPLPPLEPPMPAPTSASSTKPLPPLPDLGEIPSISLPKLDMPPLPSAPKAMPEPPKIDIKKAPTPIPPKMEMPPLKMDMPPPAKTPGTMDMPPIVMLTPSPSSPKVDLSKLNLPPMPDHKKPELRPHIGMHHELKHPELHTEHTHEKPQFERPEPVFAPSPMARAKAEPLSPVPPAPTGKLQKVLEELSAEEFDLPPLAAFESTQIKYDPVKNRVRRAVGPKFLPVSLYEEMLVHLAEVDESAEELLEHNHALGQIEVHTKETINGLLDAYDTIQKTLLSADEKLFKVK